MLRVFKLYKKKRKLKKKKKKFSWATVHNAIKKTFHSGSSKKKYTKTKMEDGEDSFVRSSESNIINSAVYQNEEFAKAKKSHKDKDKEKSKNNDKKEDSNIDKSKSNEKQSQDELKSTEISESIKKNESKHDEVNNEQSLDNNISENNHQKIDSQHSNHSNHSHSNEKKSKKSGDGILNRVSRLFSQGSNNGNSNSNSNGNNNSNKARSIHSSHSNSSTSISTMNDNDSSSTPSINMQSPTSQEPGSAITDNSSTIDSNNKTFKKKKSNRLASIISYGSSNESKKKNSLSEKRNSESKSPEGIECVNIPLEDGQIAIESHPLLKYRVDYMLQENISDVIKGSYVAALGAHTSYWQNRFLIYHIMKSIITKTEYEKKNHKTELITSPLI